MSWFVLCEALDAKLIKSGRAENGSSELPYPLMLVNKCLCQWVLPYHWEKVKSKNKEAGRLYAELLSLADDIWHLHIICTSCRRHPHIICMSSAHHEDNILMSSTCHLHIQNLPELPNFMTWLVLIYYIVSAESLILSLIFGSRLSVQDVLLISFGRKFCNLFLDQFGFEYCFSYMFCFWLDLPVLGQ